MNSDPNHVSDEAYEDDENLSKQSVCTVKSKVAPKKGKIKAIHSPCLDGRPKNVHSGKGRVTIIKLRNLSQATKKAKDNRNLADLAATADEVWTGSQPTLSNFFSGKQSMRNTKKGGDACTKSTSSRSIEGNIDKESMCKNDDRDNTLEDEDLSWVMTEYEWTAMESDPYHNCSFTDN
eukprot:scaffold48472_cov29-Attheya_sp.AAC.1